MAESIGWLAVPTAILAGILRGSVPFLFVSLGECLTEKSGKINLGLEGCMLLGAVAAFAVSFHSASAALGVIAAVVVGVLAGSLHAALVLQPRVNDIAVGIAMIIFGSGVAFFFGKPYIQPKAAQLTPIDFAPWTNSPQLKAALALSPLLLLGIALAFAMQWFFRATAWGLLIRAVGDNPEGARAMGIPVQMVRFWCIVFGSTMAAMGGANLSLFYPGSWTERISSGQGLVAVALVIFARWQPLNCLLASLLFGGAQAIGPALQAVGVSSFYYLFNAAPYILTLATMVMTCSPIRTLTGMPGALGQTTDVAP
jgi:simple sugar transport system permease protein